jgi:hypothetical protein
MGESFGCQVTEGERRVEDDYHSYLYYRAALAPT